MAKTSTTISDKQKGEIIPRPVLNNFEQTGMYGVGSLPAISAQKKFILLNQDGKIVATLIDKALAEKWLADRKKGAVRISNE